MKKLKNSETGLNRIGFSTSLITQGRHKFYTLAMPSEILARCSFVSTRDEDPKAGFQRMLDSERAKQIAEYIDNGLGTIPSSIILSAQQEADLTYSSQNKTIEFNDSPKAFLILDGQHRVFGFSIAQSSLRVPVVIYNGLNRMEESRLFIDINTKQRPVPNELLLDIKSLAEYETDTEVLKGEIFDLFNNEPASPLLGLMSSSSKAKGKISRVTFYSSINPLLAIFQGKEADEIFQILSNYLEAFIISLKKLKLENVITSSLVFKAILLLFPEAAQRVKDRYNSYSVDGFLEVLIPMSLKISPNKLTKINNSYKDIYNHLSQAFKNSFTL
jgi:DGQHR domain-containing protein